MSFADDWQVEFEVSQGAEDVPCIAMLGLSFLQVGAQSSNEDTDGTGSDGVAADATLEYVFEPK